MNALFISKKGMRARLIAERHESRRKGSKIQAGAPSRRRPIRRRGLRLARLRHAAAGACLVRHNIATEKRAEALRSPSRKMSEARQDKACDVKEVDHWHLMRYERVGIGIPPDADAEGDEGSGAIARN